MHLNIYKKFKVPENILEKIIKNKEKKIDLLKKSFLLKLQVNKVIFIDFLDKYLLKIYKFFSTPPSSIDGI